jgi:preprotein translocase subunit SecG
MSHGPAPVAVDWKRRLAYVPAFPSHRLRLFMFKFLLVVHAFIAAGLVTVILMQRSEGGGLGMGGSPSGLRSARGAADFLTRATSILATLFVGLAILLAVIASTGHNTAKIDPSLARTPPAATGTLPPPPTAQPTAPAPAAPAGNSAVPLAQ